MKRLIAGLALVVSMLGGQANAAIFVNGTQTMRSLETLAVAADVAGKTVDVTSPQVISTAVVWPNDRELKLLEGCKLSFIGDGSITGVRSADIRAFGASTSLPDNSVAITKALSAIGAGGTLLIPKGIWNITSTIIAAANQTIEGEGWGSVLNQTLNAVGKGGISTAFDGLTVRNIQITSPTQIGNENAAIIAAKGDVSPIADIRVENCFINKFSYAVSITNATRPVITKNYIYSTGNNSTDTGGALQLSQIVNGQITDNIITGDPSNRFQHGMYLASDIDGLLLTGNTIRDGFYSYGIHIYGSTFVNGRRNITISNNIISNVLNGLLINKATPGTCATTGVVIANNQISAEMRTIVISGATVNDISITGNILKSGASSTNASFELIQNTAETATNIQIENNIFAGWGAGKAAIEINGVTGTDTLDYMAIQNNVFKTIAGGGTLAISTDDPADAGYGHITITGNTGDAVMSSTYLTKIPGSGFYFTPGWVMKNNSWDYDVIQLVVTATYDAPSLVDGAGITTTLAVTGAALGDYVTVSCSRDLAGMTITAYVSAPDVVSVRLQNESGGVIDLANATLKVKLLRL